MTARPWTGAERRDALRWHAEGMRQVDIAIALDRTTAAVHRQLWRQGVLPKRVQYRDTPEAARTTLRAEIELARAERATAAPFKPPGPLAW